MRERFLFWENPKDAILTITLLLMVIGAVNVFSASFVRAADMMGTPYYFLIRYIGYGVFGLLIFWFFGYRYNYKNLMSERFATILIGVSLLSLVVTVLFGTVVNGSRRWLYLAGVSLQPSEIAKAAVILIAASLLGERLQKGLPVSLIGWPGNKSLAFALACGYLIYKQPDMGTAAIVLSLMLGMYILAGIPAKQVAGLIAIAGVGMSVLAVLAPYRLKRVLLWLNPWADAQGGGYQMAQSLLAIGSGGLTGVPWGQGSGKFFYLPEAHTDFAFAIFCQEWGFIGALFLIACFVTLACALFRIAMRTRDKRGYLLVAGASLFLIGQAAANMAMVSGVLPVIGVPLMFISYGGTAMVINLFVLGLVISVYRSEAARELREERIAAGLPPTEKDDIRIVASNRYRRRF